MNQALDKICEENDNKIKLNKEKDIYDDSDKNKLEMHSFLRNSLGINCSGHKQFKTTPRFREPDSVYLVALPPVGCCPRIYCLR